MIHPTKFHKNLLLILFINCVLILFIFILAEVGLRILNVPFKEDHEPTENAIAQFDKDLGWAYIPNISQNIQIEANIRNVYFDKNGIRVPHKECNVDDKQPSVLFIGGSYTMGHGLSYEESFPGQLSTFEGFPYQVVNLGVQAYGSDQSLISLKKFLHKFNTKIVVYTFIESHISRNGNYDRRLLWPTLRFLGTKPLFALNKESELYIKSKPLLYKNYYHSYLLDFLKIKLGKRLKVFPPFPETLTKRIIQKMQSYCKENNVHFVVINWRYLNTDYNNLRDTDVKIIDTLYNAPSNWKHMTIPNDGHPNAKACNHVAQLLFNYFQINDFL